MVITVFTKSGGLIAISSGLLPRQTWHQVIIMLMMIIIMLKGDFDYGVDDQIEIPVDPVIRETFLKYEHSSLTIFPIYVIS